MKHTYIVEGMTCNGCKASVEKSIVSLEEVSNVTVDLDAAEVAIEMKNHITLSKLQEALSSKYTISEIKTEKVTAFDSSKEKSEIQQLFPLFLIFGYITIAAIFSVINPWNTTDFMLNFMGLFYIVFSFFKLLDVKGFAMSFGMYDPLSKVIPTYGFVYPFIELALGIFFLKYNANSNPVIKPDKCPSQEILSSVGIINHIMPPYKKMTTKDMAISL